MAILFVFTFVCEVLCRDRAASRAKEEAWFCFIIVVHVQSD